MKSHPEWVRGLKLRVTIWVILRVTSHPEWVRGLKLIRSLAGGAKYVSHPEWVRGLKLSCLCFRLLTPRRTPSGCVD